MTRLEELTQEVAHFSDTIFGKDRPFTAPLHHLKKEVDETIESGALDEYADMLLLMLDSFRKKFPNLSTSDLIDRCKVKMMENRKRKWGKPDENGVIEHVRD